MPDATISTRSRLEGRTQPRTRTTTPRAIVPIARRPNASAPADSSAPAARMPTNADAHSTTVIRAAAIARPERLGTGEVIVGGLRRRLGMEAFTDQNTPPDQDVA